MSNLGRLHLRRSKTGQYFVDHFGFNGRILHASESFTQKPSAWTNIKSTAKSFGKNAKVIVQDDSLQEGTLVYEVTGLGKIKESSLKPKKIRMLSNPKQMRKNLAKGATKAKKRVVKKAIKKKARR